FRHFIALWTFPSGLLSILIYPSRNLLWTIVLSDRVAHLQLNEIMILRKAHSLSFCLRCLLPRLLFMLRHDTDRPTRKLRYRRSPRVTGASITIPLQILIKFYRRVLPRYNFSRFQVRCGLLPSLFSYLFSKRILLSRPILASLVQHIRIFF